MDNPESRRKQRSRVRERHAARRRRRQITIPFIENTRLGDFAPDTAEWWRRIKLALGDVVWYVFHRPQVLAALIVFVAVIFGIFVAQHVFSGHIFPGVQAFGIHLGDMTVDEAEAVLLDAWENQVRIDLRIDGKTVATVTPAELGMQMDARRTAEAARGVGMAGIPFGYSVAPQATVDYTTAQNYLLDLWNVVNIASYNAGYEWKDGQLVGVPGREGRELDVVLTMERLMQNPVGIASARRLDLLTLPVQPDVMDPSPFLEDARELVSQPIQLTAYDPIKDESLAWTTTQEEFTRWLAAGQDSLTLREEAFVPFLRSLDAALNTGQQNQIRYFDEDETIETLADAVASKQNMVTLRVRYHTDTYTVIAGDTGQAIARKTGIPFYLLEQANPGRNMDELYVDDQITLPSRDVTLPEPVVPNKRIIVDLDKLVLTAFENGQVVFTWRVSSGRDDAPTSPGIYQILGHDDIAVGSGVSLCGDNGLCGTWRMHWFMGIYEVRPGLKNGFHGAVELPNGAYLAGGNVGGRDTYGCLMSEDSNARTLYEWADTGTIVEIVSREFQPQSQLGWQALSQET